MATKKAPTDTSIAGESNDLELDQAIDDLRGVLKQDSDGLALDSAFGTDFPAAGETDFGADFGAAAPGLDDFGGGFGAGDIGSDFSTDNHASAASDFGASDFGASDFGGGFETERVREPGSGMSSNLDLIKDIPIDVQIVLGSSRMQVSGLMGLAEGATIALDRKIGEPVDVVVNGRVIGRGEITVLEEDETRFGVKIIEIKGTGKA